VRRAFLLVLAMISIFSCKVLSYKICSYIKKIVDIPITNHSMIAQGLKFISHKKINGKKISDPNPFDLLLTGPFRVNYSENRVQQSLERSDLFVL